MRSILNAWRIRFTVKNEIAENIHRSSWRSLESNSTCIFIMFCRKPGQTSCFTPPQIFKTEWFDLFRHHVEIMNNFACSTSFCLEYLVQGGIIHNFYWQSGQQLLTWQREVCWTPGPCIANFSTILYSFQSLHLEILSALYFIGFCWISKVFPQPQFQKSFPLGTFTMARPSLSLNSPGPF